MNERNILWRVDHPFIIKLYDTYNRKKEVGILRCLSAMLVRRQWLLQQRAVDAALLAPVVVPGSSI